MSDRRQAPPPLSTESGEAARLRGAIDEGRLRDKVSVDDPAATPLGTDDEAGGAPVKARAGEPGWRISAVPRSAGSLDVDGAASAPGRTKDRPGLKVMAVALALLVLLAILALAVFVPLPQRG